MIIPVILAGGTGTRLWPLSRALHPKQVLRLTDSLSMIQTTLTRLEGVQEIGPCMVICNEKHRFTIGEQLRAIDAEATIMLEPVGRNTAPAVTSAAFYAKTRHGADAQMLVLPADHHIGKPAALHDAVRIASSLAKGRRLITFGIEPQMPETGYGYIRKGPKISLDTGSAFEIDAFVEKPDLKTAEGYFESGDYLWNSGMFLFGAEMLLDEMGEHAPDILSACEQAVEKGTRDLDFFRLDKERFESSPSNSIDYAVMEHTKLGTVVPLDAEWNDVGSWEALFGVGEKDEQNNVVKGDVLLHDVHDSFVHAGSRLVTALGVSEHIIVETSDAVLITPRDRAQEVSGLVAKMKRKNRTEVLAHRRVYRPWGWVETLEEGDRYQVKRLLLHPGARVSSQKHHHRAEHWVVVRGCADVQREDNSFTLKEDESTYIPIGVRHRLHNPGKIPLEIIEVRTGSYLEEDDVFRFEDDYGR